MIPPASTLHRDQTALVVIDIQERLAAAMERREQVIARTTLLLRVAGIVGLPVIVTRQYPKGLGDTEPALAAEIEALEAIGAAVTHADKLAFDCFCDREFVRSFVATGRSQVLIAGMESHICVCQTALSGLRESFDVHVAADATCSRKQYAHETAMARLRAAGAVVTTAESAAYELVGAAGTDEFRSLLGAVKG